MKLSGKFELGVVKIIMEPQKKAWKFFSWQTLLMVTVSIVLNSIIWIAMSGIPLIGLPDKDNVESITLYYFDSVKEISDTDNISLLVKAANLCNYRIGGADQSSTEIKIVYHLKDGKNVELSANAETMWWKGHSHKLKEKDSFANIIKGLYF